MKLRYPLFALAWSLLVVRVSSAAVLYTGSLNTTPDVQNWFYGTSGSPTQSAAGGVTTLTSSVSDSAGYAAHVSGTIGAVPFNSSHPLLGTLDRTTGYTARFTAQVTSESHSSTDRAGFSIIALSSDKVGIELGFWTNEIFAQTDNSGPGYFQHGEGATFSTTGSHQYDLAILGSQYRLFADGNLILSGATRDYSGSGVVVTSPTFLGTVTMQPYNTPNYLFLGDDTSSAGASINLASVEVLSVAVPEPSSLVLLAVATLGLFTYRRKAKPNVEWGMTKS